MEEQLISSLGELKSDCWSWEPTVVNTRLHSPDISKTPQFYRTTGLGVTLETFHFTKDVQGNSLLQSYSYIPEQHHFLPQQKSRTFCAEQQHQSSAIISFLNFQSFCSNSPGFYFQLDLLDPSFISASMYDHSVAHQQKTWCTAILPLQAQNRNQ